MLSRIADALFWLNRYMERSMGMLRVTYVHYILSLDKDVNGNKTWRPVLEMFTNAPDAKLALLEHQTLPSIQYLLVDPANNNSLKELLTKARENARGVQDHITKEVWEEVNQMYHLIKHTDTIRQLNESDAIKVVAQFIKQCIIFTGTTEVTMSRGMGWNYMNLGRYIERCLQTILNIEKQLQYHPYTEAFNDILQWRFLLLSLSGYEMHLKSYPSGDHYNNIMHQVIHNENFAHSILYSLRHIDIYLQRIADKNEEENTRLLHSFGRLFSTVQYADLKNMSRDDLERFLGVIKKDLLEFSRLLSTQFFSYS